MSRFLATLLNFLFLTNETVTKANQLAEDLADDLADRLADRLTDDLVGFSNFFMDISDEDSYDFGRFDRQDDEVVTQSDLTRHESFDTIVENDDTDSMEEPTNKSDEAVDSGTSSSEEDSGYENYQATVRETDDETANSDSSNSEFTSDEIEHPLEDEDDFGEQEELGEETDNDESHDEGDTSSDFEDINTIVERKNSTTLGLPSALLDFESYTQHHWGLLIGASILFLILAVVFIVVVVPLIVEKKIESKKSDYEKIYAENEEEVLEPPEYEYEESEKEPLNDNAV